VSWQQREAFVEHASLLFSQQQQQQQVQVQPKKSSRRKGQKDKGKQQQEEEEEEEQELAGPSNIRTRQTANSPKSSALRASVPPQMAVKSSSLCSRKQKGVKSSSLRRARAGITASTTAVPQKLVVMSASGQLEELDVSQVCLPVSVSPFLLATHTIMVTYGHVTDAASCSS
jgi:hypothetical protein